MTIQTLTSNRVSDLSRLQVATLEPTATAPVERSRSASPSLSRLPYEASLQVELLHLQAETEALLQQLQALKQQRLAETASLSASDN